MRIAHIIKVTRISGAERHLLFLRKDCGSERSMLI